MVTLNELKKLPPQERIKRLKEMEEQRKKEIKEAEKMMAESEEEAAEEERVKREIPVPEMKPASIDELFTGEGAAAREETKIKEREDAAHRDYLSQLAMAPQEKLNERVEYLKGVQNEFGSLNEGQQEEAQNLLYAINDKYEAARKGQYNASDTVIGNISDDKKWLDDIAGYKRRFHP